MGRHHHAARAAHADGAGRAGRVRARVDPQPDERRAGTREGAGREAGAHAEAHGAPAARGEGAARAWRDGAGHRPILQRLAQYDFEADTMSDDTTGNDNDETRILFGHELSERELLCIGIIVANWGALEYEIFCQTLMSFDELKDSVVSEGNLPKEMNNLQFSKVLELWESRVIGKAKDRRKAVLEDQIKQIRYYYDYRNAIVHGMWDWSIAAPEKITALRVRKNQVISVHFTANDLASFAIVLSEINFKIRYPGGFEEFAEAQSEQGSYMSRKGLCLMTSNPLTDDLFPEMTKYLKDP